MGFGRSDLDALKGRKSTFHYFQNQIFKLSFSRYQWPILLKNKWDSLICRTEKLVLFIFLLLMCCARWWRWRSDRNFCYAEMFKSLNSLCIESSWRPRLLNLKRGNLWEYVTRKTWVELMELLGALHVVVSAEPYPLQWQEKLWEKSNMWMII